MKIITAFVISLLLLQITPSYAKNNDNLTQDYRIKTYNYTKNEVYLLVLHFGFQSSIEFSKGERIETISLGESYAWKVTPLENRIFIKPMERNIRTNMTVITNRRTYQFDIVGKDFETGDEKDLVYVIRFEYPVKKQKKFYNFKC